MNVSESGSERVRGEVENNKKREEERVRDVEYVSAAGVSKDSPSEWARTKAIGEESVKSIHLFYLVYYFIFFPFYCLLYLFSSFHFFLTRTEILPWATVLKPTVMFGDEDRLLNRFGRQSVMMPAIPVVAQAQAKRVQPLSGVDFSDAVLAALTRQSAIGKTYVLGGPEVFTWEGLANKALEATRRRDKRVEVPEKVAEYVDIPLLLLLLPLYIKISIFSMFLSDSCYKWDPRLTVIMLGL